MDINYSSKEKLKADVDIRKLATIFSCKLALLTELEGYDDELEFLENCGYDSVVPGICTNENCEFNTVVEPDSDSGWCDNCSDNSVTSALVLAGII